MSTAAKALILTWVTIGFLIVGGVGFYLGGITAPKTQLRCPSQMMPPQGGIKEQEGQQQMPQGQQSPQQQFNQQGNMMQQQGDQPPTAGQQLPQGGGFQEVPNQGGQNFGQPR